MEEAKDQGARIKSTMKGTMEIAIDTEDALWRYKELIFPPDMKETSKLISPSFKPVVLKDLEDKHKNLVGILKSLEALSKKY
jgi:hypothetical protein